MYPPGVVAPGPRPLGADPADLGPAPIDALAPTVPTDPFASPIAPPVLPPRAPASGSTELPLPPLTEEQRTAVKGWLEASKRDQQRYLDLWKSNLTAYAPPPEYQHGERGKYEVNTNVDFRQAEQKKAQLWFDTADVQLTPIEPLSELALAQIPQPDGSTQDQHLSSAITLHQTVLNQILSRDGVNAKRTLQAAILDVLVPSGWGVTHIGYTSHTRPVTDIDPLTGMEMTVQVPVYEEYFWARLSPSALLVPVDFHSTDFDKAPWLAIRYRPRLSEARREFGSVIPPDFRGGQNRDEAMKLREESNTGNEPPNTYDPYVNATLVYYYEPTLNAEALHPKRVCEIVFIEGIDTEVRHRFCPYQSLDAEGKLTSDSMVGYPLHILTLRDVPDDNHVPSDSSMTRPLTEELNQYRSQILKSRDASIPYAFYDEDILPPEKIERITSGEYGPMIPVEGGRLNAGNPPVLPGNKPTLSRETYAGQDVIERDLERTLAIGSNQTGVPSQTRRTATEVATIQSSVDTRLAGEQARVVEFFCAGVRKLDALVQRFSDEPKVTQILGPDGTKQWLTWDKTVIAGRFAYTIRPDSQIRVDAAADRQQDLAFYNLTARDPFINRYELARRLALKWGFNPDKLVQQPPPQGPPVPNVQVRIQASDLDPRLPQFPIAMEVLTQSGYQISPEALQNAVMLAGRATEMGSLPDDITPPKDTLVPRPTEHPGAAEKTEPIGKHEADRTGMLPGGGAQFAEQPV